MQGSGLEDDLEIVCGLVEFLEMLQFVSPGGCRPGPVWHRGGGSVIFPETIIADGDDDVVQGLNFLGPLPDLLVDNAFFEQWEFIPEVGKIGG